MVFKAPPGETKTERELRMLVLSHYALGVLTAFKLLLGLPLLFPGLELMKVDPGNPSGPPPPKWFVSALESMGGILDNRDLLELSREPAAVGVLLVFTAAIIILISVIHGFALAYIGWLIARRKGRLTSVIFSWFDLMYFPFGTVLSLFAIKILGQQEVREMFAKK